MYIEKRWLLPGILSLLLFGALCAVALVLLGQQIPVASGAAPDVGTTAEHRPVRLTAALCERDPGTAPQLAVAATLPPPPPIVEPDERQQQPEEQVAIVTENSAGTQVNTRGFGDIGMQFQDVTVNAPITNVHISNQGNNNATNVAIGDDNVVVSRQKDLESDRTDSSEPPVTGNDGAERTATHAAGAEKAAAAAAAAADTTPPAGEGGSEGRSDHRPGD
jgi:hypothetical protein